MIRHRHVTAATVVAVLALAMALFTSVAPRIRGVSKDESKRIAVAALVQSQSAPNPACAPAAGAGHMGICAPTQAMALANELGVAAGDPDNVRSLGPIGVDVSNNNGCSYSLAAHRAKFVWFKAGEGLGFADRCAAGFRRQAQAAGIPYGGYEFIRPRPNVSPRAEAAAFAHRLFLAGALGGHLPPVADAEVNDRGMGPNALNAWVCGFVRSAEGYLHRRVDIYTGFWFWTGGTCGSQLWEAAYAPQPIVPNAWRHRGYLRDLATWQHTDGQVGPAPHYGADTDVMLNPARYGLRVKRGRLVTAGHPKPSKPPTGPHRNARKLARWQREYARVHAAFHRHRHSKTLRVRNRALSHLIRRELLRAP